MEGDCRTRVTGVVDILPSVNEGDSNSTKLQGRV